MAAKIVETFKSTMHMVMKVIIFGVVTIAIQRYHTALYTWYTSITMNINIDSILHVCNGTEPSMSSHFVSG